MGILEGKVAVITGSSRGLGFAIAQAYAREGAAVVLSGRDEETVHKAVEMLKRQGARVSGLPTDVSDLTQVRVLAEHAIQTFGKLDIWVNNAGIGGVYGPTLAIAPQDFERVLRTNIFGEYYGSLVALEYFIAQGTGGKLINLLGRGDDGPVAFQNAYASSKVWVRNFTLALAKEYQGYAKKGVGIFAFNPGLVNTDLLRKIDVVEGYAARLARFSTIIRWWANPPAIPAEKAVWLASAATDGKTGLEVRVLSPRKLIGGILNDVRRQIKHQPAPDTSLKITSIVPQNVPLYHLDRGKPPQAT